MEKKLSEEEEKKIRAEIREKLAKSEEKKDQSVNKEHEIDSFAFELEKKRIRDEETEKFYVDRGYKKYIDHYGAIEWLTSEEYNKRIMRKKRAKSKRHDSKKRQTYTTAVLMAIIIILVALLALIFVNYVK
jgi:cation transport ATPase